MTNGVSNIGRNINEQFLLQRLRNEMTNVQTQINTGKKGTTFSGLNASESSNSMSFRAGHTMLQSYVSNINIVKTRTDVMDKAMLDINDSAQTVMTRLLSQLQDADPQVDIVKNEAAGLMTSIQQKLNSSIGDRYLFAGTDITNSPYASPSTLDSNMAAQIATWMAGTPTQSSVINDARTLADTDLGFSNTLNVSGPVNVRVDNDTNIDYTVKANNGAFSDIMRGMAIVSNLQTPTTPAERDNYWTIVNGAIDLLKSGTRAMDIEIGILGNKSRQMDDLIATHKETRGSLEIFIGEVEDVDMADAVTRFNSLELQLQASYNVTARVSQLSLVNFI